MVRGLGIGADRIALRLAEPPDARRLLDWRNHPATRAVSLTSHEISAAEHAAWFEHALADPHHVVLIVLHGGHESGVVRFAIDSDAAHVSIAIDPAHQGAGLGVMILRAGEQWLQEHRPAVRRLIAHILPENTPSHRIFRDAGYICERLCYVRQRDAQCVGVRLAGSDPIAR